MPAPKVTTAEFLDIVKVGLPQVADWDVEIESLEFGKGSVILPYQQKFLRLPLS